MNKVINISFLLLLSGCIFDGSGWGNNPTITDSDPSSTSTSTSTTFEDITTSATTSTNTSTSTSTGAIIIDSTTSAGSTGFESTSTGVDSTGFESSSSGDGSSTGEPETCGDCMFQRAEECDPCLYAELKQSQSYCSSFTDPEKCVIIFEKPLAFITEFQAVPGMKTVQYDQEEADLLCKLFMRSEKAIAGDWVFSLGYNPNFSYVNASINLGNWGILLKSATPYYSKDVLYFYEYDDYLGGLDDLDWVLYANKCQM